ncbi:hypothetical protein [Gryllotalpicola koreensis]|uniref:Uncharacterized protein n=1 Tax=Gryllotalpicola koreensis TaxID=993086 RepID=A0ABP8A1Q4_9MICO
MSVPLYATLTDFQESEFSEDDSGEDITDQVNLNTLKRASRVIHNLVKTAYYTTDPDTKLPVDDDVIATLRDATCAQAAWFVITENASGWLVSGPHVQLGPLSLGNSTRSSTEPGDMAAEAKYSRISPEAVQILKDADFLNQAVGYGALLGFWSR